MVHTNKMENEYLNPRKTEFFDNTITKTKVFANVMHRIMRSKRVLFVLFTLITAE